MPNSLQEFQRRAVYGPIPVSTRTFREIWEPLVHMNFKGNSYGPIPWCLVFRDDLHGLLALKVRQVSPPETSIGPWMAFPRVFMKVSTTLAKSSCNLWDCEVLPFVVQYRINIFRARSLYLSWKLTEIQRRVCKCTPWHETKT